MIDCIITTSRATLTVVPYYNLQQNFIDYHKCVNAKGEDYAPCKQFMRAFRSLCPSEFEQT